MGSFGMPQIGDFPTTTGVSEKEPLGRVNVPVRMIARLRELAKWEHASLATVVRRALRKEIDAMRRKRLRREAQTEINAR